MVVVFFNRAKREKNLVRLPNGANFKPTIIRWRWKVLVLHFNASPGGLFLSPRKKAKQLSQATRYCCCFQIKDYSEADTGGPRDKPTFALKRNPTRSLFNIDNHRIIWLANNHRNWPLSPRQWRLWRKKTIFLLFGYSFFRFVPLELIWHFFILSAKLYFHPQWCRFQTWILRASPPLPQRSTIVNNGAQHNIHKVFLSLIFPIVTLVWPTHLYQLDASPVIIFSPLWNR